MSRWIVDTDILTRLARYVDHQCACWSAGAVHITEWVEFECLGKPGEIRPPMPEMRALLDRANAPVVVHSVLVGSPTWDHIERLHGGGDANRGEMELIALGLTDVSDGIFVSLDKRATYTALVELGPDRVASAFDLFADLIDTHELDAAAWEYLCGMVQGYSPPPRLTRPT